jgi:hypothetical protein
MIILAVARRVSLGVVGGGEGSELGMLKLASDCMDAVK